ncbi:MAG: hypothetical protein AAF333_15900 [Planctomycetota bacterium]
MEPNQTFNRLLTAWNEDDETSRAEIVRQTLAETFLYADQHRPGEIQGREEFEEFLSIFRSRVPGVVVSPGPEFSHHHGYGRADFVITRDSAVFATGTYFLMFDEDARITRMIGFVDANRGNNP